MIPRKTVCEICDDSGSDWTDGVYVYHLDCVRDRVANPNNERERHGLTNTLQYGKAIQQVPELLS